MRLHTPLLASGLLIISSTALFSAPVTGNWYTYGAKSMIKITQCGNGLCGRIVWLRQKLDSNGQPVRDERNLNKRHRTRKVLGLSTFSGLAPAGPKRWSGLMYNPDDGRTYKASLTILSAGTIRVEGCRVGGGPCGARSWVRAKR